MKSERMKLAQGWFVVVVLVVLGVWTGSAAAWGALGHKAVAQVAYNRLTPRARSAVDGYLNGETIQRAAVYPDDYRSKGGAWSSGLHFVNFPRDATRYLPAYCGDPAHCVVAAVSNYTRRLASEGFRGPVCMFTTGSQPCPLSFLTHFVGDIHQPLHCGYADDKGGNSVSVRTFWGKSTNLHSLWDSGMLEFYESNIYGLVAKLEDIIASQPAKVQRWLAVMDPAAWAEEGFQIVKNDAYRFTDGRSPRAIASTFAITEEYYAHNIRIVVDQLAAAGVRLASIINASFP